MCATQEEMKAILKRSSWDGTLWYWRQVEKIKEYGRDFIDAHFYTNHHPRFFVNFYEL
jgi:hypothetical protein